MDEKQPIHRETARAYLLNKRDQAIAAHPSLKNVYVVEDQLRAVIAATKPISPVVQTTVESSVRKSIAAVIARGDSPRFTEQGADRVRFAVAYRSMEHAIGENLLRPEKHMQIDGQHRALLVAQAEKQSAMNSDRGHQRLGNEKIEARHIAGNLAMLDRDKANNPFSNEGLSKIYDSQIKHQKYLQERGSLQNKDRER